MNRDLKGRAAWILKRAGWSVKRDCPEIAQAFREGRGGELFPAAEDFVRKFGGITIGGCLWVFGAPHPDHFLTSFEGRISDIVGAQVVPVAGSIYMSSTSIIWLDERGRFYAADEEGMVYLGEGVAKFFGVVLLDRAKGKPPEELRERLEQAYKWDA